MADKRVGINVQLKLDSEAFSRKVENLSGSFTPLEIPVKLKSLGINAGIGPVKIKADIDPNTLTPSLTVSLKTAFGSVTAKLGDDIGEKVGKSIEKIKPSAFSGIIGAIASPFQKIATGALEGVGREMSAKLGQGLAKGIEKQTAPVIGSFELLGEKLVTNAAPRLGNTIGGKLAKSLFNKESVKQAQQDFKQFLTTTVGESDALIASQSQKAREGQKQQGSLTLARRELGTQLADFVATTPQRQQQAAQLRSQDAQLGTQQQAAQERVTSAQGAITSKREQLAKKQEQILKKLESQGTKIDDTLRAQVAKQVQSAPATVQELAKLEVEYAKSSQSLTGIVRQRQTIQEKIKRLSAPVSPIVSQLELLGVKQPEIAAIRERTAKVNQEFDQVINTITSDIGSNIATIQNLRKDIAVYKKQLQNLVDDYNFQLNFIASDQEKSDLLKETIQQRKQVIDQIDQAESEIAAAANAASQKQKARGKKQQEKANVKSSDRDYVAAQAKLVRQATGTKQKASPVADQLFPDVFSSNQPSLPQSYQRIIEKVGELSGKKIKSSDIPSLTVDPRIKTANLGSYNKQTNAINVGAEDYKKLASGQVSKELIELISHELRHALQFDYGKNLQGTGVKYVRPNDEELIRLQGRIKGSTDIASKGASPEQRTVVQKTEMDAYTFADRYGQEILNYVKGISAPQNIPSLKTKLTERQRELNSVRTKAQEQLFNNLTAENKANLEQLTGKQLTAIARSSGISGYSNKKVADLRQMLLQQVKPEELSFRIPTFSKVDPQIQQDASELLKLPLSGIKQEVTETNRYLGQGIKSAAKKKGDPESAATLRLVLDGITEARKVYASALAQDIDQETRNFLRSAIATLGKQRIAAQSRLTSLSSSSVTSKTSSAQSVANLQFSIPATNALSFSDAQSRRDERLRSESVSQLSFADAQSRRNERQSKMDLSFSGARSRRDERIRENSPLSFKDAQSRRDERVKDLLPAEPQIQQLLQNAELANTQTKLLIQQINKQMLAGIITADVAVQKTSAVIRASQSKLDTSAQKQNQAINKSSEASFQKAQQALKQLEAQINQQVSEIEARARYNQQQQQKKQTDRLRSYGIDQTAPVDIAEQRPEAKIPSVGKVFNNLRTEFQDFRTSGSRKQAQALNQQAQAILVDLDSQIAIGKASVTESKVLQKQIAENEKRIQQIIAKVRAAKEGRVPPLTAGDLQRLSGQLNQLGTQVDADKARVAEIDPAIARGKRLQPVANDLRGASNQGGAIASQKNISDKDLTQLNQYNQQVRKSLELLGQTPAGGGFLADLNLKMPGLLKNVFSLVKGFLAFQVVNVVQQQLQQLAVTAFQTSLRFEALEKSLNFATGGEGAQGLEFVRKEVDRLSLPLEASIKGFTGLAAAARGTSIEGARTQKIFTGVAQAARVYNLTADQTEGAFLAVEQIISKGCYDGETEVLTDVGWIYWEEATLNHRFATIDLKTKVVSYQSPTRLIRYRHTGKMLRVASPDVDLLVTPDHRMVVRDPDSSEELIIIRASELQNKPYLYLAGGSSQEVLVLPEHLTWVDFDDDVFCAEVPNTTLHVRKNGKQCISGNSVQAEELRGQLGERIPGAVQIFARAMGVSTSELNKLLEGGKVGLDDLSKFADQLATETAGGVNGATKTAAASLQRLQNSFTDLNKQVGDAIAPAAIAVFDALSSSMDFTQKNAKLVQSAFAALALTTFVALIPSITALGGLLLTFATVTLPFVARAMLATVAANPILIASLAALAVGMIVAEDGAKALANALNGVSQAQIDAADNDAKLDSKYNQALLQLNKQIPLTKEQIDLLTNGLDEQAKRGVNTAKTSELLKGQLFKLQSQAEATAAAQDALNKAVLESETAFKKGKNLAEVYKSRGDLSTAKERARGLISDDAVKDREYESEQKHNINMSALNNARMIDIKNQLAESQRLQNSGKKGLDAKQEKELKEELLTVEKDANQAQVNLANNDANRIKEVRDRRLKDFDEAQTILESKQKAGNITEEKLLQDRLVIQQQKGDEQLADIKQRREALSKTDKEGLEALAVEEAQANANIKEAQKTAFDQRLALSQKRADGELVIALASKSKGLLTETQFNEQQYAIRTTYLDDQLAVLKAKSATISKTDIDAQLEVKAKESQILQQRTEARKAFVDAQLAQLEREQQKATDLTTLATKGREIDLQKLVNSRVIKQEDVQAETLKVARTGIEKELELERSKLQQLQDFPKYDDPIEEEGRQTKIRQSRIRTSDLQLQLLQNEKSQQEAVYAAYARAVDRVTRAIANRATAATQSFNTELLANSALEKSLSLQNQLLDAQKNLRSALGSYVDAEFQVLQETAKGEREKKKLAEAAANIKLQSARLQAESDRQSLELQIQQTDQAQRRLEVENAIAQIRNRADTAKSQAELAKVSAKGSGATPEQIEAARLGVVASTAEGEGLQQQAQFLAGQRATNTQTNQLRRQTQDLQSGANITRAEFEAANAIANRGDRRRALRALQDRARSRIFGTSDRGEASTRLDSFNEANRGRSLTPLEQYRANIVQNRVAPTLPAIELPKVMPMLDKAVSSLGTAVDSLVQLVQQKLSTPATVTIATPINNYFPTTPNPKDVASGNTQAARKELYDLGMLIQRS
jgi:tape measure domain-containing protein